ncbi:MAG: translation initiation factor [Duncaniella sp.]|nr:translation initiation factor [Duncaniella sp.]
MDWKDILASKIESGELQREDSTPVDPPQMREEKKTLHVQIERKGRKGKTATIIFGFDPEGSDEQEVNEVARRLKQQLATGGSARGGEILIQGERMDEVKDILKKSGYKVS